MHHIPETDRLNAAYKTAYLYVSIAQCDGALHASEEELIISKLALHGKFDGLDLVAVLKDAKEDITTLDIEAGSKKLAACCSNLIQSEAERTTILKDLEDLMDADGQVRETEMDTYRAIQALLEY